MSSKKYKSTRGAVSNISFEEAVLMGLATDSGLLVPEVIPSLSVEKIESWSKLSFQVF